MFRFAKRHLFFNWHRARFGHGFAYGAVRTQCMFGTTRSFHAIAVTIWSLRLRGPLLLCFADSASPLRCGRVGTMNDLNLDLHGPPHTLLSPPSSSITHASPSQLSRLACSIHRRSPPACRIYFRVGDRLLGLGPTFEIQDWK
jgi:hypothetical protein